MTFDERLAEVATKMKALISEYEDGAGIGEITPDTAHKLIGTLPDMLSVLIGEYDTAGQDFARRANGDALGEILLGMFGDDTDAPRLSTATKRRALDVAESIGPDHAQTLYRFAVLVTKLA